jgi:MFS family permease
MSQENAENLAGHDAYAALRVPDFRLFMAGNFLGVFGMQMQAAAIDWEMYERTGSNLRVGLVGLVQFLPVILLAPITGHVADRYDRRRIVILALGVISLVSMSLAWISAREADPWFVYGCLFLSGIARAFQQPARASFLPQIVPAEHFSNAVSWNTGAFHFATVLGPSIGGALIELTGGAAVNYMLYTGAALGYVFMLLQIRTRPTVTPPSGTDFKDFAAGFAYLWRNQVIFGAISLDLLAVLFGGATALLPAYAKHLGVGPTQLGLMQAAPPFGAFLVSILLAHRPPFERAGRALLLGVTGFGVAIIVFGLSNYFWLSLPVLVLTGAFDNVSVVIRHTLVQVLTPNELRGRVSAVNGLFIGASNELGRFESGTVAHLFGPAIGPMVSVVSGGVGTLLVVIFVALMWPQLRRYGRLGSETTPA